MWSSDALTHQLFFTRPSLKPHASIVGCGQAKRRPTNTLIAAQRLPFLHSARRPNVTFHVVLSNPYDFYSLGGQVSLGQSTATATIAHGLATDADNDSPDGTPDNDIDEALFKDAFPGKVIAVQKYETNTDGTQTSTPDPNTRFVPIKVTLVPGYTETLEATPGLEIWDGPTPADGDLGTSVILPTSGTVTQVTYYVEALSGGLFKIDLFGQNMNAGPDEPTYLSDEAQFTAVDENTCVCCLSGAAAGSNGQLVMDQTFLGGAASVISTALSEYGVTVSVTYVSDNPTPPMDYVGGLYTATPSMTVTDKPYLVLAGNAVLMVNGSGVQIWDHISSGGPDDPDDLDLPWEPRQNYTCDSGTEVAIGEDQGTMTQEGSDFLETDTDGTKWLFDGDTGQLISETPPDGEDVTYSGDEQTTQTGPDTTQVNTFSYNTAGQLIGITQDNTSGSTSTSVASATFAYYGGSVPYDPSGNSGQLQMVTTYVAGSSSPVEMTYYRYYTYSNYSDYTPTGQTPDTPANLGLLKFVFNTTSIERMDAAGIDYLTASDSVVAPYADQYFSYLAGQIVWATTQGSGITQYSYVTNGSNSQDPNAWSSEKIQTQANSDGSTTQTTTYYNDQGDLLLTDAWNGDSGAGSHQITYNLYDPAGSGNVLETAQTSAVGDYGFSASGVVEPSWTDTGLIDVTTYYSSTTASTTTPGGVTGWAYQTFEAHGETEAAEILSGDVPSGAALESTTDYIQSPGGAFFTADSTTYAATDGGDPEKTTYLYKFDENAIVSQTTILPAVTSSQNGNSFTGTTSTSTSSDIVTVNTSGPSGLLQGSWVDITGESSAYDGLYQVASVSGDSFTYTLPSNAPSSSSVTVTVQAMSGSQAGYNAYGQAVWLQSANGSISYTQYDPATGATTETIGDVDFGSDNFSGGTIIGVPEGDYTLLTTTLGWVLPPDGGKNQTTVDKVDSQGRTIEEIDPDGNVTWTVYQDAAQTVSDSGGTAIILSETRTYPGWHYDSESEQWETTGPVQVSLEAVSYTLSTAAIDYSDSLTYGYDGELPTGTVDGVSNAPLGTESLTGDSDVVIQSLSRSITNDLGQTTESLQYTSMPSGGYLLSTAAFGSEGVNYLETDTFYDSLGRSEATVNPTGTVSYTVYDGFGRDSQEWKGTMPPGGEYNTEQTTIATIRDAVYGSEANVYSDSGVELYKVSASSYDADGNLIESDAYVDPTGQASPNTTYDVFDWQDRQIITVNPPNDLGDVTYTLTTLDNMGEATTTQEYLFSPADIGDLVTEIDAAQGEDTPAPFNGSSDTLLAQSESDYSGQGSVFESRAYNVASSR